MQILEKLMFDGPNSLFFKKLIETGKAPAFSPGVGFDYTTRQGTFTIGVQGVSNTDTHQLVGEIEKILVEFL